MELINLEHLKNKKNLLAFSGGTDSSALFHALVIQNIDFDIALVNYNTRDTSFEESCYAKELVDKYNELNPLSEKVCFIESVNLDCSSNFEMNARNIRYVFFNQLILEHGYDNLITGHNLNDKMEWFLMQMTKGAGIKELFGMEPITTKDIMDSGKTFDVVRPLLATSKNEILNYLEDNHIKHYLDKSNEDEKYKRNHFRKNYVSELVSEYSEGIKRTFNILEKEVADRDIKIEIVEECDNFVIVSANDFNYVYVADILLKKYGYVMSRHQRVDLSETHELVFKVDNYHLVISYSPKNEKLYLTPYGEVNEPMNNEFKEKMRKLNIPVKNRNFFFSIKKEIFESSKDV